RVVDLGQDERDVVPDDYLGLAGLQVCHAGLAAQDRVDLDVQPLLLEVPLLVGDVQPGLIGGGHRVHHDAAHLGRRSRGDAAAAGGAAGQRDNRNDNE